MVRPGKPSSDCVWISKPSPLDTEQPLPTWPVVVFFLRTSRRRLHARQDVKRCDLTRRLRTLTDTCGLREFEKL